MKHQLKKIFQDTTFLLFLCLALSHVLNNLFGYPIWWIAKYGLILFATSTAYQLIKKRNSVILVTVVVGSIVAMSLPFCW